MNAATLSKAMGCSLSVATRYLPHFEEAMRVARITTVNRAAMWCAQIGHESAGLVYMEELASGAAYEGRLDLGNTQSGDGRRFKGSGPIQLTGRANFTKFSKWCHEIGKTDDPQTFVRSPHLVRENPKWGFLASSWYWTVERPQLNALSDARNLLGATRAINGGTNGLADRRRRYNRCLALGKALLPTKKSKPAAGTTATWKPTGKWTIKKIQQELGVTIDSKYGNTTKAAVKELQQDLGLTADGLWGPNTEEAVVGLKEDLFEAHKDIKEVQTQNREIVALLAENVGWTERFELTPATAESIGWGDRKNPTMTFGGYLQTTLRLSADAAKGVQHNKEEIAKIADEMDDLIKATEG